VRATHGYGLGCGIGIRLFLLHSVCGTWTLSSDVTMPLRDSTSRAGTEMHCCDHTARYVSMFDCGLPYSKNHSQA